MSAVPPCDAAVRGLLLTVKPEVYRRLNLNRPHGSEPAGCVMVANVSGGVTTLVDYSISVENGWKKTVVFNETSDGWLDAYDVHHVARLFPTDDEVEAFLMERYGLERCDDVCDDCLDEGDRTETIGVTTDADIELARKLFQQPQPESVSRPRKSSNEVGPTEDPTAPCGPSQKLSRGFSWQGKPEARTNKFVSFRDMSGDVFYSREAGEVGDDL